MPRPESGLCVLLPKALGIASPPLLPAQSLACDVQRKMSTLFSPSEISFTSVPLSSTSSSSALRADGRSPLGFRDLTLDLAVVPGCVGSARVVIGDSQGSSEVWAGVRAEVEDVVVGELEPEGGRGRVVCSLDW